MHGQYNVKCSNIVYGDRDSSVGMTTLYELDIIYIYIYNLCFTLKIMLQKSCRKYNITVSNYIYIHTNITTCYMTQSQFPNLLFFNFINIFFKILMYSHQLISVADFD
jgi:hypothetical protein